MKKHTLYTAVALVCASSLSHAVVTFSELSPITGDTSEIISSTAGITIENFTQFAQTNTFIGTASGSDITAATIVGDVTTAAGPFTADDFGNTLSSFGFANSLTYTLDNLTVGLSYDIQFFFNDSRDASFANRTLIVDDGNGNVATVDNFTSVTGTFIAEAETQDFTLTGSNGAHINLIAFSGGVLPVPEPSSALLLGLGGLALGLRRRR